MFEFNRLRNAVRPHRLGIEFEKFIQTEWVNDAREHDWGHWQNFPVSLIRISLWFAEWEPRHKGKVVRRAY